MTPTTWAEYCNMYECYDNNTIARRKPINEEEGKKYYMFPSYLGYFRDLAEMNIDCATDATKCKGHVVNIANTNYCELGSYTEAQLKWNDIAMESRGPEGTNNGYNKEDLLQIWEAAAKNEEHVMMWLWYPHPAIEEFEGTNYGFYRVNFPRPNEDCIEYRRENIQICSANETERTGGSDEASCDYPVQRPQKYLSRVLKTRTLSASKVKQSPSYFFLQTFEIPTYAMEEIFEEWVKVGKDYYGYDSREAVCKWVYDNLEMLELYIPRGYPRNIYEERNVELENSAYILGAVVLFIVLLVLVLILKFRERRAMRFAQVGFLLWMITGMP